MKKFSFVVAAVKAQAYPRVYLYTCIYPTAGSIGFCPYETLNQILLSEIQMRRKKGGKKGYTRKARRITLVCPRGVCSPRRDVYLMPIRKISNAMPLRISDIYSQALQANFPLSQRFNYSVAVADFRSRLFFIICWSRCADTLAFTSQCRLEFADWFQYWIILIGHGGRLPQPYLQFSVASSVINRNHVRLGMFDWKQLGGAGLSLSWR